MYQQCATNKEKKVNKNNDVPLVPVEPYLSSNLEGCCFFVVRLYVNSKKVVQVVQVVQSNEKRYKTKGYVVPVVA